LASFLAFAEAFLLPLHLLYFKFSDFFQDYFISFFIAWLTKIDRKGVDLMQQKFKKHHSNLLHYSQDQNHILQRDL
jgi:hypothetical protein